MMSAEQYLKNGCKWIMKRPPRHAYPVAVIQFLSANGEIAYRRQGERSVRYSTKENFLKRWKPVGENL